MAKYKTIEFERVGSVGWLRLDRPEKLNSFTVWMWHEMRALGEDVRDDPELRAVVVIGKGRAFSSGIDTSVFTAGPDDAIQTGDDAGTRHDDPTIDGIIMTTPQAGAYNDIVKTAEAKGIPVATTNSFDGTILHRSAISQRRRLPPPRSASEVGRARPVGPWAGRGRARSRD